MSDPLIKSQRVAAPSSALTRCAVALAMSVKPSVDPVMVTHVADHSVIAVRCAFFHALDVVDHVADGAKTGQVLVGDLHAVLVLGLHCDSDRGQRVEVQVVDERHFNGDLGRFDAGHLLDDLGESGDDLFLTGHAEVPLHLGSGCFYGKGGTGMLYNRLRGVEQFGYLTLEYPPPMSMRSSPETELW